MRYANKMMISFAEGVDRNNQVIKVGDTVQVLDNAEIVKRLMEKAWHKRLLSVVGRTGKVSMFGKNGDVLVYFCGLDRQMVIKPKALTVFSSGERFYN